MFKFNTGKYGDVDWQDDVKTWGITHVPGDQYISLDFGSYYIKLEWGFINV